MEMHILFDVFVFLLAACVAVPLASRFKLGSVLGYLAAGILIGPYGLALIKEAEQVMHFAEFGVVMMLFVIGLELEPAMLWRMRRSILGLGGLQVVLCAAAFTAMGMVAGYSWQMSAAVGMALALSSTALVLQMLQEKKLMQTEVGENAFAVLLFQDIAVIPILIVMPMLALSGASAQTEEIAAHAGVLDHLPGWLQAICVAGVIAMVIFAGRYLSRHVFYAIAKTNLREVFTATSLALVVGITLLMQLVGMSPALGAFVAGVVLANSEYRHTLETDLQPFKGLLLGLFFISVGMGMDFAILAQEPLKLLGALLVLIAVKAVIIYLLGMRFGITAQHNIGLALALAQGGEFAFVLFQFAGGLNILPPADAAFLTLVVALSMAVTPLLMLAYSAWIVPRFMSVLSDRDYDAIDAHNPVIVAGFGRFGQIISRFLWAQGVGVTVLEKDPDQIELLRKFGFKGYFGDASRLDMLQSAGASHARILVVAVAKTEQCLEIVTLAKKHFPNLKVIARARNRRHAFDLHNAGVDYFRREIFDSALTAAQEVMVMMGQKESDMRFKAEQFMRHDETVLYQSFAFFDDEDEMVNFAKTQREELERLLQDDSNKPHLVAKR